MIDWRLGTVGFSYKDWDGVFYPENAPVRSYLPLYSKIFNTVELDSTFYGTPPIERVVQWASMVPDGFKFCPKMPRQITHEARLKQVDRPVQEFLTAVEAFGDRLGAILVQFPPSFTAAEFETVDAFLGALPRFMQFAVEFRHQSWFNFETVALLRGHNVCWTSTAYLDLPKQISLTTDFHYIRWLGRHGQFNQKNR